MSEDERAQEAYLLQNISIYADRKQKEENIF
jgi:hypothetical protein